MQVWQTRIHPRCIARRMLWSSRDSTVNQNKRFHPTPPCIHSTIRQLLLGQTIHRSSVTEPVGESSSLGCANACNASRPERYKRHTQLHINAIRPCTRSFSTQLSRQAAAKRIRHAAVVSPPKLPTVPSRDSRRSSKYALRPSLLLCMRRTPAGDAGARLDLFVGLTDAAGSMSSVFVWTQFASLLNSAVQRRVGFCRRTVAKLPVLSAEASRVVSARRVNTTVV